MTTLQVDRYLTRTNTEHEKAATNTHAGMATWAGTGPQGKTCFQCEYWGAGHKTRPKKGTDKSGCAKWVELTTKHPKPKAFPGTAKACRYFVPHPDLNR